MSGLVEKYYTAQQLGWLLELSDKTIRVKAHAGEFGPDVLNLDGKDIRIPASGVHAYTANHRLCAREELPVAARSEGELRRKVAGAG